MGMDVRSIESINGFYGDFELLLSVECTEIKPGSPGQTGDGLRSAH